MSIKRLEEFLMLEEFQENNSKGQNNRTCVDGTNDAQRSGMHY
jgi:hypothetical protein